MERRRVMYVVHNHPKIRPGGAEAYALELYEAMRSSDEFEPFIVARTEPRTGSPSRGTPFGAVDHDPNEYFVYTDPKDFDFFTLCAKDKSLHTRHFRDLLLAIQPHLVHFQHTLFIGNDLVTLTRQTLPDVPIVYTLHEFLAICHRNGQMLRTTDGKNCTEASPRRCNECFPDVSPQRFFLRERLLRSHFEHVDLFLAPSRFLMERYIDWGIPKDRIRFEDYGRLPQPRVEGPSEGRDRTRFGFFGQFNPYKGVTVTLQAMTLLAEAQRAAKLRLHGANLEIQPEEFQDEFNALVDRAGTNVTVSGRYDHENLPALMAETDWVIVPSIWWENSPLVIQEAFIHGRPIICSDIGGMAEKVDHGVNGLHFRANDPQSLAEAIQKASGNVALWNRLHEGIPQIYSMDRHVSAVSQSYTELMLEPVTAG